MTQAIFLSYASQDTDAAHRLCDALRAAGLEVWFDQSELRGGDAWDASIRKQIKDCVLFVPIISANTQQREEGYFRLEWKLAVDRSHLMADNKAFFFPVILGDVAEAAALVPDKFRERQWTRFNDDAAIEVFASRVAQTIAKSVSPSKSGSNNLVNNAFTPFVASPSNHLPTVLKANVEEDRTGASTSATRTEWGDGVSSATQGVSTAAAPRIATPSIAVLAFANRSASADDEYFSDGLADELLNVLAKIKGLRVAARTSAFSFKGKQTTVAEIGNILNVATVLEGSVRTSGSRVRISVQLVKVNDGFQLWGETYDRTLEDIFAVQDDIAQAVVTELRGALMGEKSNHADEMQVIAEITDAGRDRSENSEAQRLFLRGRYLLGRKSAAELMRSIDYFKQAVALDPHFALAWAWLGQAYCDAGGWGSVPVHEAYPNANAAATLAIALAPGLVQAHMAMASFQISYQWDWARAEATVQRALQLAPDNADVLTVATRLAFCLNHFNEAEASGLRAIALDPLNAGSYRMLALVLFAAGKFDAASEQMRHALALAPDAIASHHVMSNILCTQGRFDEALAEAMLEKAEWARLTSVSRIQWAMNTDISRAESTATLAQLIEKHSSHCAIQIAGLFALRGDADAAFLWLERAYAQRESATTFVNCFRYFHPVKGDPRWPLFLKKMGFDT